MTQTSDRSAAIPMAYAAALVLIMIIVGMNLVAILLRNNYRKKYRW
jgi:phosphate transport system permease protein